MDIIQLVNDSWGWTGINAIELVTENDFGNLIVKDSEDGFWRVCPEDVYCEIIANSIADYNNLIKDEEFLLDWNMTSMISEAIELLGPLKEGYKYHMVMPGVLGGEYNGSNFNTAPLKEIIMFSGELGNKIKDLPDGEQVKFKIIE